MRAVNGYDVDSFGEHTLEIIEERTLTPTWYSLLVTRYSLLRARAW